MNLNKYSKKVTQDPSQPAAQAMLHAIGLNESDLKKPFVGIVGGAKVSDKIKIIERLLSSVDQLIIGGAMANTLLKAQGFEIGKSLTENKMLKTAEKII